MKVFNFLFLICFLFIVSCKKEVVEAPQEFGCVQDIDGNNYMFTDIKGDYWMVENLTTSRFQNGDTIPQTTTEQEWEDAWLNEEPVWCYYNNDSLKGAQYGKIYNFYAIRDSRGIAPQGWHISTESEWYNLENSYGGEWNVGQYLKSENGWADNGNGTNESYFNALPGGSIYSVLYFYGEYTRAWFWTSTFKSDYYNQAALLPSINNLLNITEGGYDDGMYVRCVKDN